MLCWSVAGAEQEQPSLQVLDLEATTDLLDFVSMYSPLCGYVELSTIYVYTLVTGCNGCRCWRPLRNMAFVISSIPCCRNTVGFGLTLCWDLLFVVHSWSKTMWRVSPWPGTPDKAQVVGEVEIEAKSSWHLAILYLREIKYQRVSVDVSRVLKEHTYVGDGLFVHLGELFQSLQQDLLPRCFRPSVCLWKNIYIISCDGVLAVLKEKTLQERTQNE